jgi:tetratricopeptide (TPR) repeat protein
MLRLSAWLPVALIFLISLPLAAQQTNQGRTGRRRTFSISGVVRDSDTNNTIDGAKVELRATTGGTIATMFTSAAGNFQFDGIASGGYNVVIDQIGYLSFTQDIQIQDSPVMGLQIDLHRPANGRPDAPASPKVSAHELAVPRKAQDSMERGVRLLYDKSDYHGSITEFQRAVQAYPDFYEAYAQMGVAYVNLGDSANAEASFRKSYDLSEGKYIDACFLLAKLLSLNHRYAEAEPIARKGVEIDPNSWQANEELARALMGLNRYQEAEPNAVEADTLKPNQPAIQLILSDIHLKLRNYPALLENLNAYLKLVPTGPQADKVRQVRDQLRHELANSPAATTAPQTPGATNDGPETASPTTKP